MRSAGERFARRGLGNESATRGPCAGGGADREAGAGGRFEGGGAAGRGGPLEGGVSAGERGKGGGGKGELVFVVVVGEGQSEGHVG